MDVTRRPATAADTAFARHAHHAAVRDTVERQFGAWDEARQDELFDADWNGGAFEIFLADGVPAGYCAVEDQLEDVHVRELVLNPAYQGRGIASGFLRELQATGARSGLPIRLGTRRENPARHLYARLGFHLIGETATHVLMEWTPVKLECRAVLFDLDGVLVDSTECVERTWRAWAKHRGLDPERVVEVAHGRRSLEVVSILAPELDANEEAGALAESESTTTAGVYEVAGARELVARLPAGAWAVVTSGVRRVASLRITHTGLPSPTVLVAADDIERGKPDPQGYLTAARRLGVEPEDCVVIEDAPVGIEAGLAAGMRVVAVASTHDVSRLRRSQAIVPVLSALEVVSRDGEQFSGLAIRA